MKKEILESFNKTRVAGSIAAQALDEVAKIVKPGILTSEIDELCYNFINDNGAYSAPLFYRGFPKSCCTSTNHVVCHGIPSDKILKDGDIVKMRMLENVFRRGVGAYRGNPESVRRNVTGPDQWAIARVNAYLFAVRTGRFRSGQFDRDLLPKEHPLYRAKEKE